jgi:uncharacterized protein YaiI (UPF0178 family)
MTRIYVDADGCPVKDEVYRVAGRYDVPVTLVANSWMQTPNDESIELVVVGDDPDEADDWIADRVNANEIVITADIPLAARCLKRGAYVLGTKGRVYTEESMGEALAGREVASQLREHGIMTGGPAPFSQKDRSRFLQRLDDAVNACLRAT